MTATYCGTADVGRTLGLGYNFGTSTTPTALEVTSFIEAAQDEIDHRTQHAWRTATVTNEFYDLPRHGGGYFSAFGRGRRVFMRHRNVITFATGSGDKLEVWNGNSYDDWLSTKTEGRANDYWQDEEQGELFLNLFHPLIVRKALRLTYRHGESTVPKDVKDACAMLVAMEIVVSDDRSMVLSETGDPTRSTHDSRWDKWKKRSDRILGNRTQLSIF